MLSLCTLFLQIPLRQRHITKYEVLCDINKPRWHLNKHLIIIILNVKISIKVSNDIFFLFLIFFANLIIVNIFELRLKMLQYSCRLKIYSYIFVTKLLVSFDVWQTPWIICKAFLQENTALSWSIPYFMICRCRRGICRKCKDITPSRKTMLQMTWS